MPRASAVRALPGALGLLGVLVSMPAATAMAPADRPLTESGVWLDASAPRAGDSVRGVVVVSGSAQAPEGVLSIALYVLPRRVAGSSSTPVAELRPALPALAGPLTFALRWDTRHSAPGTVDLRVVARTAVRGLGVDVRNVRITPSGAGAPTVRTPAVAVAPQRPVARPAPRAPHVLPGRLDTSGRGFGEFAGLLPYGPPPARTVATPLLPAQPSSPTSPSRRGPAALAAGLVLLLLSAHANRALRPTSEAKGTSS